MNSRPKFMSKFVLPLAALLIIVGAVSWIIKGTSKEIAIPFSSMTEMIETQKGAPVSLEEQQNGKLVLTTEKGDYVSYVPPNSQMVDKLVEKFNVQYTYTSSSEYTGWILGGLVIAVIAAAVVYQRKNKGGLGAANTMKNSVARARALPSITISDVGGLPKEMKEEILQTLSIVKDPEKSAKVGIKPPKGILLYGPPGTGKTLLAQAMAREIGASFYSASGASFNEMFVGVGASRVRSLFQTARKQSPAVIFIDEVDALAAKRKQHGGEESEKTLTELLVQLDGGHQNDGILFIAATNRKDMLDEAFLRPGRIDFSFEVPLPDTSGRRDIIEIHAKGKKLSDDVAASLDILAESTSGFSGAELSSLFEMASRRAVRNGSESIQKSDLDFALDRTILGSTSRDLKDADTKRRVAIHETGHALISSLTKPGSVRKATIIPRGQALGYVAPLQKEMHLATASDLMDQVKMILAGGVSERLFLGEHSIGVGGDVQQAKKIIEQMVDLGVLQEGFTLSFSKEDKEEKMKELFYEALAETEMLIDTHRLQFDALVNALLKKETLEGWEVDMIVNETDLVELASM
ncbi:AAA family ATPase [Peribacillus sp. SCS-26]|uniref:AAA family ATPase n=1 Tax=Paraperibacillus marinus TaxID=3115295 RepID=UPI0039063D9E